jgi:hypothetical protein
MISLAEKLERICNHTDEESRIVELVRQHGRVYLSKPSQNELELIDSLDKRGLINTHYEKTGDPEWDEEIVGVTIKPTEYRDEFDDREI